MGRQQLAVIDYLKTENHVYREQLGGRRIRFTDDQRRRLSAKAKVLGRKALSELDCIVTPDTLLRWYRKLVAEIFFFAIPTAYPATAAERRLIDNPPKSREMSAVRYAVDRTIAFFTIRFCSSASL
jgi:hypothetical protein